MNDKQYEEKIKQLDKLLGKGFQNLQQRREQWDDVASNILAPTLDKIKSVMKNSDNRRGIYVSRNDFFRNFETVQFRFGHWTTGISYEEQIEKGKIHSAIGVERGAALVFSLGEDGRVSTLLYPFQSELPEHPNLERTVSTKRIWLGKVFNSPKDITVEEVYRIVISFIEFTRTFTIFTPTESEGYDKPLNKEWREIVDGVVEENCKEPKKINGFIPEVMDKDNKL